MDTPDYKRVGTPSFGRRGVRQGGGSRGAARAGPPQKAWRKLMDVNDCVPMRHIVELATDRVYEALIQLKRDLLSSPASQRQRKFLGFVRTSRYLLLELLALVRWLPVLSGISTVYRRFRAQDTQLQQLVNTFGRLQRPISSFMARPVSVEGGIDLLFRSQRSVLSNPIFKRLAPDLLTLPVDEAQDLRSRVWTSLSKEAQLLFTHVHIGESRVVVECENEFAVALEFLDGHWTAVDARLLVGNEEASAAAARMARSRGVPFPLSDHCRADGYVQQVSPYQLVEEANSVLRRAYAMIVSEVEGESHVAAVQREVKPFEALYREMHERAIRAYMDSLYIQALWLQQVATMADVDETRRRLRGSGEKTATQGGGVGSQPSASSGLSSENDSDGADSNKKRPESESEGIEEEWGWWDLPGADLAGYVRVVKEELPLRMCMDVVNPEKPTGDVGIDGRDTTGGATEKEKKKEEPSTQHDQANRRFHVVSMPRLTASYWFSVEHEQGRAAASTVVQSLQSDYKPERKEPTTSWWAGSEEQLLARGGAGFTVEPDLGAAWDLSSGMEAEGEGREGEEYCPYFIVPDSESSSAAEALLLGQAIRSVMTPKHLAARGMRIPLILRLFPAPAGAVAFRLHMGAAHLRSLVHRAMTIHTHMLCRALESHLLRLRPPGLSSSSIELVHGSIAEMSRDRQGQEAQPSSSSRLSPSDSKTSSSLLPQPYVPSVVLWVSPRVGLMIRPSLRTGHLTSQLVKRDFLIPYTSTLSSHHLRFTSRCIDAALSSSLLQHEEDLLSDLLGRRVEGERVQAVSREWLRETVRAVEEACRIQELNTPPASSVSSYSMPRSSQRSDSEMRGSQGSLSSAIELPALSQPMRAFDSLQRYERSWMFSQRSRQLTLVSCLSQTLMNAWDGEVREEGIVIPSSHSVAGRHPGSHDHKRRRVPLPETSKTQDEHFLSTMRAALRNSVGRAKERRRDVSQSRWSVKLRRKKMGEEVGETGRRPRAESTSFPLSAREALRYIAWEEVGLPVLEGGEEMRAAHSSVVLVEPSVVPPSGVAAEPTTAAREAAQRLLGQLSHHLNRAWFTSATWYNYCCLHHLSRMAAAAQVALACRQSIYHVLWKELCTVPLPLSRDCSLAPWGRTQAPRRFLRSLFRPHHGLPQILTAWHSVFHPQPSSESLPQWTDDKLWDSVIGGEGPAQALRALTGQLAKGEKQHKSMLFAAERVAVCGSRTAWLLTTTPPLLDQRQHSSSSSPLPADLYAASASGRSSFALAIANEDLSTVIQAGCRSIPGRDEVVPSIPLFIPPRPSDSFPFLLHSEDHVQVGWTNSSRVYERNKSSGNVTQQPGSAPHCTVSGFVTLVVVKGKRSNGTPDMLYVTPGRKELERKDDSEVGDGSKEAAPIIAVVTSASPDPMSMEELKEIISSLTSQSHLSAIVLVHDSLMARSVVWESDEGQRNLPPLPLYPVGGQKSLLSDLLQTPLPPAFLSRSSSTLPDHMPAGEVGIAVLEVGGRNHYASRSRTEGGRDTH